MAKTEVPACLKKEIIADITDFRTQKTADGKMCLARLIQNLVVTEPNTYPNTPDLGVGIELYQFETGDDTTMAELKAKVENQIKRFIPQADMVRSVEVFKVRNRDSGVCTVVLNFQIDDPKGGDFLLVLNQSTQNYKVVSQIVF